MARFDGERYATPHPVKLTCTTTSMWRVPAKLQTAFGQLERGALPEGSASEEDVRNRGSSYSLPFDQYSDELQGYVSEIHVALDGCAARVWRLLRWRVAAEASDTLFQTVLASEWSGDGGATWYPLAYPLHVRGRAYGVPRIDRVVIESVENMILEGVSEPISEELLREAWSLRSSNPRAALLLAIAAAEVGFKELLIDLAPQVEWIALHVQSPPIVDLLKHALPELPVRQGHGSAAPTALRKVIGLAVEARNRLAHRGQFNRPDVDLDATIEVTRTLLRQFAYYRGMTWATPSVVGGWHPQLSRGPVTRGPWGCSGSSSARRLGTPWPRAPHRVTSWRKAVPFSCRSHPARSGR